MENRASLIFLRNAKRAREKINTFAADAPLMRAEEPKMGTAQRRLEESANQIEEKLNRVPSN